MGNNIGTKDIGWNFNNSYAKLPELFYRIQKPTPVNSPKLVILNDRLAAYLGLNVQELQKNEGIGVLSGNIIPEGALPIAQAYAGHQFGHFTMLGDGRAILLGEQITPSGTHVDIQLKGAGRTPYSRGGDGRAALKPMLREYIISEAMFGLGIPTTRSLAVVTTGEQVFRENVLKGAVLTRVAASHLRIGTFQYAAKWGTIEELRALAEYALKIHFLDDMTYENKYLFLLKEVINRQAQLVAAWQMVGFIHGVMNTDNVSICGETIDYGPCAFMDTYDPKTVFSSIDSEGRYAYGNQPYIANWNLVRFAETLVPILHNNKDKALEMAQSAIDDFSKIYNENWISKMRSKLGIFNEEAEDENLINGLLSLMHKYKADFTNTFRGLTFENLSGLTLFETSSFSDWYKLWQERLKRQEEDKDCTLELMKSSNPMVIPRNHKVEEALEAADNKGDLTVMKNLINVVSTPYILTNEQAGYVSLPEKSNSPYRTFCGT